MRRGEVDSDKSYVPYNRQRRQIKRRSTIEREVHITERENIKNIICHKGRTLEI